MEEDKRAGEGWRRIETLYCMAQWGERLWVVTTLYCMAQWGERHWVVTTLYCIAQWGEILWVVYSCKVGLFAGPVK